MSTSTRTQHAPAIRFENLNWVATTPLLRDREQSHRLHEPEHLTGTIDPITGKDIVDLKSHPHLNDGKLTIYFESEETMQQFLETPLNHPFEHSLGRTPDDADRGG